MSKVNLRKLQVELSSSYYEEVIEGVYLSSVEAKQNLGKNLAERAADISADNSLSENDKNFLLDSLTDEHFLSEKTTELAGEMLIIAFYKTIEISIKDMLKFSGLFTAKQINSFFRVSELKKNVNRKVCDMEMLTGYHAYNELRCINNCIKHSGKVNDELARFSNWNKGDKLSGLYKDYWRLKSDVNIFVEKLKAEIISKI